MKKTFTAILTTHNNPNGFENMKRQLISQTRQPDTLSIVSEPNHNDWGHVKRALGLSWADTDYVGFFNDDDVYAPTYVEKMMALVERYPWDVVFCDWDDHEAEFAPGSSTSGNFIVKTSLAQHVGYNHRGYKADGAFIQDLLDDGAITYHVKECLYWHDGQRRGL